MSRDLEDLEVHQVGTRGDEVVRRIHVTVRDAQWGTVEPAVSNLAITQDDDDGGFHVEYDAEHRRGEIDFFYHATIDARWELSGATARMEVSFEMDGVAPYTQDLIEPGSTYTYSFTTDEQAVAMYHPHAHGHMLLPNGMFGTIIVGDVELPRGQTVGLEEIPADLEIAQEIPMVLNDSGVIGYSLNGKSFPATQPYTASVGDWVLIHYYNEGNQIHPMHLHQFDQIVVAKDGYPVDEPYTVDTLNVAPGERYSVLVHIDNPGVWVWHCHILNHVEREEVMFGMVTAFVVE